MQFPAVKKIFSFFCFSLDMLGMIGFGGEHPWTCLVKIYRSNLLSLFPTVFYKNVGWGNFEGYEKLEAVLRWDVFFCLKLLQVLQSLKGKLKANHQREIIMSPKERDGNIKIFLPLKLRKKRCQGVAEVCFGLIFNEFPPFLSTSCQEHSKLEEESRKRDKFTASLNEFFFAVLRATQSLKSSI